MGACGALIMSADEIHQWATEVRATTNGAFQLNTWIPDPPPLRNVANEAQWHTYLSDWQSAIEAQANSSDDQAAAVATLPDIKAASLASAQPAALIVETIWREVLDVLG